MRETLRSLAPEWEKDVLVDMTASPRTFERFTGRFLGFVGGVPRRAGLHNYRGLAPRHVLPGLFLVGDSRFPGQSTLAAAVGGRKLAEALVA
jgi:phytoene dehydrogenase-like protein